MKRVLSAPSFRNPLILVFGIFILFFLVFSGLPSSTNPVISATAVEANTAPAAEPMATGSLRRAMAATSATPFFAPAISATKVDALQTDVDSDGKADPGDTLMYTVTISNTGPDPATGVQFNDTIDNNTTLVPGSVAASPIAVNDSYNTIGNVHIQVAAPGVRANDLNPNVVPSTNTAALVVTQVNATAVPGGGSATAATTGGSVLMNSDGGFTYTPNAGFRGPTDSFTYTLGNTTGKTDTATVTIAFDGLIWFVNNDAGAPGSAPGDGRLSNPFRLLTGVGSFNTLATDAAGDAIFLYTGTAAYTGGVTLLNEQIIIGHGAPDSILMITGFTAPSGTNLLPATNAMTDPLITTTNTVAITLGEDNQLHGFTVGDTGAMGTDVAGTNFMDLTVKDVTLNGSGRTLNLMTGTIVSGSTFPTLASVGGSPAEGIRLNTVGGGFTVTTTNIQSPTGTGIDVQSAPMGTTFNFGATTVNKTNAGTGVNLNNNLGTYSFSSLAVTTSNGTGVSATSSGTVNVSTGSIAATGGPALVVNPTALGMTFTTVSSTNSGTTGISLTSASGSLSIGTTTITNPTGAGISVVSSSATLNFGTTTSNGSGGTGVVLGTSGNGNTGTITFGDLDIAPDSGARGLHAVDNSATLTATSGTISTSGGNGVEITRASSTTPLAISFTSVTSSGAQSGIRLERTSGSFSVVGTGGANSGGQITNSSGDGVFLNTTSNVSLTDMTISTTTQSHIDATSANGLNLTRVNTDLSSSHGILGSSVTNLNILGGTFDRGGAGAGIANFHGVFITNLLGNSTVTSATFRRSNTVQFRVNNNTATNFAGTPDTLTVTDTDWNTHNGPFAGDHLSVSSDTGGNFRINVNASVGINTVNEGGAPATGGGIGVQAAAGGTNGKMHASITGLKTTNNTAGVAIAETGGGSITYNIFGNKTANGTGFSSTGSVAIVVTHASTGGTSTGIINDNSINHTAGAGTNALQIVVEGNGTGTATISNNVISGNYQRGIQAQARTGTGTLNLTINNNSLTGTDTTGNALQQVNLETGGSGTGHDNNICLNMHNNTVNLGPGAVYLAAYRLVNRVDCTFLLQNFAGSGASTTDIMNWVTTTKMNSGTPVAVTINANFGTSGGCPTPVVPMSLASLDPQSVEPQQAKVEQGADQADLLERWKSVSAYPSSRRNDDNLSKLTQEQLSFMVQAAIQRFRDAGASPEDLARLESVLFETADLPDGRLAETGAARVTIDETAAGYGWFLDSTPIYDEEFTVGVPGRELQTTELSLAHRGMDLLTVVMRALGNEYAKGKERLPESLQPLMDGVLATGVRRLPDASRIGFIIPEQPEIVIPSVVDEIVLAGTLKASQASSSSSSSGDQSDVASQSSEAPITPQAGETINLMLGTLPPGESITIMFQATINALGTLPVGTTQVCNQGTVSGSNFSNVLTDDPDVAGAANPTCTQLDVADLIVTKSDSPDPVIAGQNITYTINFENDGPQTATNVSLSDAIPANTTFVSVTTPAGWTRTDSVPVGGTGTINFTKASVADEETAVFTLVVQVAAATADGTVISNTVSVTSSTPDTTPANNTDTETTNVIRRADLIISKSDSPDPVPAGTNLTYTINFENDGPNPADNTTITDAVPANTTFVSAVVTTGTGWSVSAPAVGGTGNVVFSKASVADEETAVFTIVVKVNDDVANGATITNTAVAASDITDPTPANNSATATTTVTAMADLAVTKSDSPDPAFAGNNITYTINFTNNGPNLAANVTVTDAVPANTTFVSAMVTTGTGWTPSTPAVGATGNVVFSKAAVANGETAVFTIVVKIDEATPNGTTITNTVTAVSTTTDPTPGNNSATTTTTANQQADLAVTKSDSPDPVFAGNNITYTVNLVNNGPGTASTVTVTDAVPANTTFVSAMVTTGTGWTPSTPAVGATGNVVFSKAAVANGETAVFSIVVRVNSNTASGATISNTATAASTTADPSPGDNSASTTTSVQTQADVSITKTDAPDPVVAGANLTYTITVTNSGPSDAASLSLSDTLPAGTTFVSVNTPAGWTRTDSVPVGGSGAITFTNPSLVTGTSSVFTLVVQVASSVANGTVLSNTASVTTTTTDPTPGNNSATATTTVNTQADLSVIKSDSPDPVVAGQDITYTINFVNGGASDAQTVVINDMVPANTTFVSAMVTVGSGWMPSLPAVGASGTVMFAKATVVAGETATFTLVVKVNAATANGTTISNTVTATSATTDPNAANNSSTATTTVQAQADLAVTKTDSPDPVIAGNNITYTVNFTNNGPSDAQTVTVTDAVPANATFVSAMVTTGTGWSTSSPAVGGTGNIVFSKATVAAGETATFTIVVKVNASTAAGTIISNTATAASTTTDPNSANNSATATTTVQAEANLVITKTSTPDPVFAGNNLTYTVTLVNNGPSDATTVAMTDAVPANTTFVSAMVTTGSGWTPSLPSVGGTGNIVFTKATVTAGETTVFTIVVNVNSNTAHGAMITNTATVTATTGDPVPADNTAVEITAVERRADLSVTKTDSPDPVIAGNNITYTVNFTNNGPSDAQTVTVTDAVPANATFVSAMVTTGTGWSTSSPAVGGTGNIVFSKATVAAGETASFTIVVKVNSSTASGATITNTATAASTTTDPTPANNSSTATTTVQTQADLSVTKTDSPDPVFAGANITYTVNFVNNGPSDAQMVSLTDAIPANTTFVSVMAPKDWDATAPAVGATGNVIFEKATVAAGETAVFTIVVKVNANTASGATITNTITAASTTTDPTPANNSSTATTTVQTQADVSVTKTDAPDPVIATQNITYTVTVTNNGPSDAQTLSLSDPIPANTTFVSVTVPSGWTRTDAVAVGGTGTLTFTRGTQPAAAASVFTIVVNVNAATPHNTVITNTATVSTATTDPTPANNTATATTTVIAQADLAISKTDAPDPACVSGDITYTLSLTNQGPGPGINTVVTDAVPANTTFVSAMVTSGTGWAVSAPAVGGTGNVTFSKASVANKETAVFTIVVKVNAGTLHHTVITNTAVVASDIPDPTPANNTAQATTTVDPIAPTISCPANLVAVSAPVCPLSATGAVVNYALPTASDNCPGVTVSCSPPSGTTFPVGTATVNCTATDAAGNTASCSFTVKVFDICLQDNANANTVILINSFTGEYAFCCNGTTYTGVGTISKRGCTVTLTHNTATRRVSATADTATRKGNATLQSPPGSTQCTITDADMLNNTCNCSLPF